MNNLYAWKNLVPAKLFAVVTMVSLILSAFPASFLAANIAEAATGVTIFEDGFETGDFSKWTSAGSKWDTVNNASGAKSGNYRAENSGSGTGVVMARFFDTSGVTYGTVKIDDYENLEYSFWYQIEEGNDFEGSDNVRFEYSVAANVWNTLETFDENSGTTDWTPVTGAIPDVSGAPFFAIRFANQTNSASDIFELDDFVLTGDDVVVSDPLACTLAPTISNTDEFGVSYKWNLDITGDTTDVNLGKVYFDDTFRTNVNPFIIDGDPNFSFLVGTEYLPVTDFRLDLVNDNEEVLTSCEAQLEAPYTPIFGCTDDAATNFDDTATEDDQSCEYEDDVIPPEPKTGDLRVCKILVDENFEAIDGSHLDSEFSVKVTGPDSFDETVVFSTALDLNTKLLTDTGVDPDAECVTFEDVATGKYTYEAEVITGDGEWLTPLYHDFFTKVPTTQADFGELTVDGSDDDNDDTDGVINLGKDKTRTLAIWNSEVPPAPICEIGENLLDNGSFEEPVVVSNKDWIYTSITDWMITALDDDAAQDGELHRGWSGNEAADGEQYAELDSRESVKMAQTVATVEGATYELKWAFAPRHNLAADENQLSVQVDGNEVVTEGPASLPAGLAAEDWTRSSFTFQATSDETEIAFADAGIKSDSLGTFLDDTALCFVRDPEPEPEIPEVCSLEGEVVDFSDPVFENDGDPVNPNRRDVTALETAAPYSNWGGKEPSWSVTDFFSLGIEGHLVYEFTDKIALDQAGPDIAIWEITGGNSGQSGEKARVYVSQDGVDFTFLETITGDGAVDIAPAGLDFVKFVKLVDDSAGVQGGNGDGFDVDAITIIEGSCDDYAAIHTTKIVCTDEADLPNYGSGGPNMTEITALEWIGEEHPSCEIVEGWEFEWGPKTAPDPGDSTIGPAGGVWNTFTGSTMVPASAFANGHLWMREVLQEGYIPFTHEAEGKKNTDDVTAEFYCHKDVKNYDNYDRIDGPKAGEDYYCVGWNVPEDVITYAPYCGDGEINQLWEQCEIGEAGCTDHCLLDNQCSMEQLVKITLDDTTEISSSFDGSIHLDMANNQIPSGVWFNYGETVGIDNFVNIANSVDGLAVKRDTFDGTLDLAFRGDNSRTQLDIVSGTIMTKGIEFGSVDRTPNPQFKLEDGAGDSFDDVFDKNTEDTMITFDLRADTGNDGVTVEVNQGEKYNCEDCEATVEARVILNDSGAAGDGLGGLSDEIILGDAGYTTVGFNEWFPISEAANPGDSAVMIDDPNTVTNFDAPGDKSGLFVSREDGTVKVAIYGEHNPGGSTNNEWIDARIEIRDAEITNFETLAGQFKFENHNGNNQPSDDFDEASADDTGVDFKMWVDTASDGFKFDITDIAECTDDSKDMYLIDGKKYQGQYLRPAFDTFQTVTTVLNGAPGLPDWTIELYDGDGNFITSTTTDETGHYYFWVPEGEYEVREDMEPGWMQVGVDDGGDYVYTDDKPYSCTFDLPREVPQPENGISVQYQGDEYNYSDYRCDFYNVRTLEPMTRIYGYKFETAPDQQSIPQGQGGWTINLEDGDGNVIDTTTTNSDGSYEFFVTAGQYYEVHEMMQSGWSQSYVYEGETQKLPQGDDLAHCGFDTESLAYIGDEQSSGFALRELQSDYRCEFYNERNDDGGNGGSGGSSTGTLVERATPQVAGAATMCPFLVDYMQIGWENDSFEVMKLQMFLNMIMGETLEVSGVFDTATDEAVKRFQARYQSEILTPWFELGIVPHNRPTGFVYKTTLWKINDIVCPDYAILPDFEGEDLTTNVNADID